MIPIHGKLAFLRYESILPSIERESRSFLLKNNVPPQVVFRLDMQEALLGKVIPIAVNKFIFKRVKASKIKDRKWHCIDLILCHLRSLICRQLSRSLNMNLFTALGITSSLRYVGIKIMPEEKKLIMQFVYDGEISERDYSLAQAAIEESRISFPEYEARSFIERVDFPCEPVRLYDRLAYWRQEWVYVDGQKIPTIKTF